MSGSGTKMLDKIAGLISVRDPVVRLKGVASLYIFSVGLLFVHLFVYPIKFDVGSVLFGVAFTVSTTIIKEFVFSFYDPLDVNNLSDCAEFFRSVLPSAYIESKYNVSRDVANYIWFEYFFNEMSNVKHKRHGQWLRTLTLGYMCRFVSLVSGMSFFLILGGMLMIFVNSASLKFGIELPAVEQNFGDQLVFLFAMCVILFLVNLRNNVIKYDRGFIANGVWARFEEINKLHVRWINENHGRVVTALRRGGDGGKV